MNLNSRFYYKLAIFNHKKLVKVLKGSVASESTAIKWFNNACKDNKENVIFPVEFVNYGKIIPSEYEILLLRSKKTDEKWGKSEVTLKNIIADNDKFEILKKEKWLVEETFWVYGYHPKYERKDFTFIINNIVKKESTLDEYSVKAIMLYHNKLIIDLGLDLEFIICKNEKDSLRLYNRVKEEVKDNRKFMFLGYVSKKEKYFILRRIMNKTGWNYNKVTRKSTRP